MLTLSEMHQLTVDDNDDVDDSDENVFDDDLTILRSVMNHH